MQRNLTIVGGAAVVLLCGWYFYSQSTTDSTMGMDHSQHMMHATPTGKDLTRLENDEIPRVAPTEIVELNDGDTFDLTASIVAQEVGNRTIKRLAYNGQIPGPIIKAKKGAKVRINFTNNIDMDTTIHSHGLRGDWQFDGTPGVSQDPVAVGESFTYELEFPDTGVFWYHPHIREDYQQDMGLYGNYIVEEEGYWNDVDQEAYLMVDDFLEDGTYYDGVVTHTLMGRYGDRILINDKTDYDLVVEQGAITRLFITNVANTRTFDLHFPGAMMKLVGGDNGRIEREVEVTELHFAPSERMVVELTYPDAGTFEIQHMGQKIGTVTVTPSSKNQLASLGVMRDNSSDYQLVRSDLQALLAKAPDKTLRATIAMDHGGMDMNAMQMSMNDPAMAHLHADGIEWEDTMPMMNLMSNDQNTKWILEDTATGKQNMDIHWNFKRGDLVKVRIHNDKSTMHPMQHPIHFHGQRFVILAKDGVANDNLQWKDTALIPLGATYDLLIDMSNPGQWMAHCHIAEHLHSGMMFHFDVTQ